MDIVVRPPITPAQIRAGRALLDWSQQQLAHAAIVGLSTVRDYEKERRGGEGSGVKAIHEALERQGVIFLPGEGDHGPGVRLAANVPNVLRWPTKVDRFGAFIIFVEWRGREIGVFVPREVLDVLGRFRESHSESEYLALLDQQRGTLLKAAATAIDAGRVMPDRRVHLTNDDFPEFSALRQRRIRKSRTPNRPQAAAT